MTTDVVSAERLPSALGHAFLCALGSLIVFHLQNNIVNAERRGKRQVLIRPSSKVVVKFLSVMQRHGECPLRPLPILVLERWICDYGRVTLP